MTQATRVYTKNPHRVPDVVAAAQRTRAAELELMYDLMRELQQGSIDRPQRGPEERT